MIDTTVYFHSVFCKLKMKEFSFLLNISPRVSFASYFENLKRCHKNRVYSVHCQLDIVYILFAFVGLFLFFSAIKW